MRRDTVLLAVAIVVAVVASALISRGRREGFSAERGCVLIVEPRKHENFSKVLDAFLEVVPSEYDTLYVYHGTDNEDFARAAAAGWFFAGKRVVFKPLGVSNLDADTYNSLFKKEDFWRGIDREKILVVQTDAVPCPASPYRLGEFERFGYIGSSYGKEFPTGRTSDVWDGHGYYGVGGLSFRRRSFCMRCCARGEKPGENSAEDVFFGDGMADFDGPKPTADDLAKFATQNSFDFPSWGAHQIGQQLDSKHKKNFYEYCPLARIT
jgi:hypothetical protein